MIPCCSTSNFVKTSYLTFIVIRRSSCYEVRDLSLGNLGPDYKEFHNFYLSSVSSFTFYITFATCIPSWLTFKYVSGRAFWIIILILISFSYCFCSIIILYLMVFELFRKYEVFTFFVNSMPQEGF